MHYIDLIILPDPEFNERLIMNALFTRLHWRLVEIKNQHIGIDFPEYRLEPPHLGRRLRLLGPEKELLRLLNKPFLIRLRDHIEIDPMRPVPEAIKYHCLIKRAQFKSNVNRLRRRAMKRQGIDWQTACQRIPETIERRADLPFIQLNSGSTRQKFPLFIRRIIKPEAQTGLFNTYGLSQGEATIPVF